MGGGEGGGCAADGSKPCTKKCAILSTYQGQNRSPFPAITKSVELFSGRALNG